MLLIGLCLHGSIAACICKKLCFGLATNKLGPVKVNDHDTETTVVQ